MPYAVRYCMIGTKAQRRKQNIPKTESRLSYNDDNGSEEEKEGFKQIYDETNSFLRTASSAKTKTEKEEEVL